MKRKEEKKTIAVVIENIFTDFAHEFISNVMNGISAYKNINIAVIAGKYDGSHDLSDNSHRYKRVYNSLYRLQAHCSFDGAIICLGSMAYIDKDAVLNRFYKDLENIPKVFVIADIEGQVCVNYENESGIREGIDYLVNGLGIRDICMLGGRDDNLDAVKRKGIFIKCLEENGIEFDPKFYQSADMSMNADKEAYDLLSRNPEMKAVFCVNDASAVSMYKAMDRKGLVPGKDIKVFGFDNTRIAGQLIPSLASVGARDVTIGQKAAETIVRMMEGYRVSSELVQTKLYGAESLEYEMYEYTTLEMNKVDKDFINRMFDDCFYRYRFEFTGNDRVDLRRLFLEFMSRILNSLRIRYMSDEESEEITELIDIFFYNGAMNYTDSKKFLKSVERIQGAINVAGGPNIRINRLFTHMRDRAIISVSESLIKANAKNIRERKMFQYFMVESTNYGKTDVNFLDNLISNFDKLGLENSAFYTFEKPVIYSEDAEAHFPDSIYLRCVTKHGNLIVMPEERRLGSLRKMFTRNLLPSEFAKSVVFPVFFKEIIYGFILCELTTENIDSGEYIADQLGRAIYLSSEGNSEEGKNQ